MGCEVEYNSIERRCDLKGPRRVQCLFSLLRSRRSSLVEVPSVRRENAGEAASILSFNALGAALSTVTPSIICRGFTFAYLFGVAAIAGGELVLPYHGMYQSFEVHCSWRVNLWTDFIHEDFALPK